MKRKGFSLWELVAVLALVLLVTAILFPVFNHHRGSTRYSCVNNLKQIGIGLAQYEQDWDEHRPCLAFSATSTITPLTTTFTNQAAYGWADVLQPYLRNVQIYQCPNEPELTYNNQPTARGYTDYWFNSNLSGSKSSSLASHQSPPANIITFGEGNTGSDLTDARYNLPGLPAAWINDQKSPLYRHLGGANYAFADGHVKMLKPAQISTASPASGIYTFATR